MTLNLPCSHRKHIAKVRELITVVFNLLEFLHLLCILGENISMYVFGNFTAYVAICEGIFVVSLTK